MTDKALCTHQGSRPLIWHHHDPAERLDWCRCQDCDELVAMEPPEDDDEA